MINLKYLTNAVELAEGNEFRVLYVIANTISLKKEGHTKIYRDMLADKLNLSTKQITRLTNSLVEKGLLKKDLVTNGDKTECYYSLILDKSSHKSTPKMDKNVPLNKRNNIEKKEKDVIKEIIDNKKENDDEDCQIQSSSNISNEYIEEIPFEEEKRIVQEKIKNETQGLNYSKVNEMIIPFNSWIQTTFPKDSDRLKNIARVEINNIKRKITTSMVFSTAH